MIVQPKVRGFICTTAHPQGCAKHVTQWIDYVKKHSPIKNGPKRVLIIGSSTGFGLASRIAAAFGAGAETIGVFFEKPASGKRTASAGWYSTAAFERAANEAGLYAKSFNGDAFSNEMKAEVLKTIKEDWGGDIDLVIYSIASPRRQDPKSGEIFNSVLKPIGKPYQNKTVDVMTGAVTDITIEPATEAEIKATEVVMGGEDWEMWIDALLKEKLLANNATSVAFTYIGPEITHPIYRNGTIGKAKEHLEKTASTLDKKLQKAVGGHALISVNKALVTQASAAIPVVPLYVSLLYKIMKTKNLHEGCIEQMWRLFVDHLYHNDAPVDGNGRIRIDDWEMRDDVQNEVAQLWQQVSSENLEKISDVQGYRSDFYRLFGFGLNGVDYNQDVDVNVNIPSIPEE
ncbi:enoyl-ACP reductase FabV [Candidiatus Paracoxiella cheracis]|uniref:enoyl-ACP reductase FabV n=1 Tax=Candidiatus Paracoxiella cheracis TaxID=3405120 RepID=UPI003BF477FE